MGYGCCFYYFVGAVMALIDKACWERGCACYDDRIDKDGVEVVKREWIGLEDEDVATVKNEFNRGALWAEQVLKEKNT